MFKRWRRSRGFGVHSPWAYTVITDILTPHYAYYAYPKVNGLFTEQPRLGRMVYRLLAYLQPAAVDVLGDRRWADLAAMSGCGRAGRILVVDDATEFHSIGAYETIIFTQLDTVQGRQAWDRALAEADKRGCGMALDSCRRLGVLNMRRDLPRQTIEYRTLLPSQ